MSFASAKGLAGESAFRIKVEMAILKAATQIAGEAVTAKPTVDLKRHELTENVILNKETWLERFSHTMASLETLTDSSTDGDVSNAVSSVWNVMAGVSGLDQA